MTRRGRRRIVNLGRVRLSAWGDGGRHAARIAWLSDRLDARRLGFNLTVLPPGRAAFPFHFHHGNEELFLVLEGRGTLRLGRARIPIRRGDLISVPPGPDSAHQLINTSRKPLRYLAVSTMDALDVAEYPDSDKVGIFTGTPPGKTPTRGDRRLFIPIRHRVGYWDGES